MRIPFLRLVETEILPGTPTDVHLFLVPDFALNNDKNLDYPPSPLVVIGVERKEEGGIEVVKPCTFVRAAIPP